MLKQLLEEALQKGRAVTSLGQVATYIPELSKADQSQVGVCVFTQDGEQYSAGDTQIRFSIQSISKIINLAAALELRGFDAVFAQVGMEPSGDTFNSMVKLAEGIRRPYNPMINSGAIAVCSYIASEISFDKMLLFTRKLCMDDAITLNEAVYRSEISHISHNRAIAYLLESKGIIQSDVEQALDFYVKMCSLNVTAESLAAFGLLLANNGVIPSTGERILQAETVKTVKTIMLTCGMYNGSGEFAVRVGLPSKSGVGGGILSVADKRLGIGIYGPSLDEKGNSIAGECILQYLSAALGLHIFA